LNSTQTFTKVKTFSSSLTASAAGTGLAVTNNATVGGTLGVTGQTTLTDLKVTGITQLATLRVDRIISNGNLPTAVLAATTTGQGSTYTIEGNDTAGTIQFTTGIEFTPTHPSTDTPYPLAVGEQVTITFDSPYAVAPRIALTAKDAQSAGVRYFAETTTTGMVVHFLDAPTATTTYTFDFIVIQ
jgi:hypothetical protein